MRASCCVPHHLNISAGYGCAARAARARKRKNGKGGLPGHLAQRWSNLHSFSILHTLCSAHTAHIQRARKLDGSAFSRYNVLFFCGRAFYTPLPLLCPDPDGASPRL